MYCVSLATNNIQHVVGHTTQPSSWFVFIRIIENHEKYVFSFNLFAPLAGDFC